MWKNIQIFVAVFSAILCFCTSFATGCTGTSVAFKMDCENRLKGVVDGGRCFFIKDDYTSVTWDEGLNTCKSVDSAAVLAQIHTSSEFKKITGLLMQLQKNAALNADDKIWLSFCAADGFAGLSLLSSGNSRWYDANDTDHKLTPGNTWLRTQNIDPPDFALSTACLVLRGTNYTTFGTAGIGLIALLSNAAIALCQLTNKAQYFKLVHNICLDEYPIKTLNEKPDAGDCGVACSNYAWCRSFNHFANAKQCELFSWHFEDGPKISVGVTGCKHYVYDDR